MNRHRTQNVVATFAIVALLIVNALAR